jgi:hypothetical protein
MLEQISIYCKNEVYINSKAKLYQYMDIALISMHIALNFYFLKPITRCINATNTIKATNESIHFNSRPFC